jgi:NAD(P) transhydrogenase subunit alpha
VLQVRTPGVNPEKGRGLAAAMAWADSRRIRRTLISPDAVRALAERGVNFLAMELMPRITRAQSTDALSSTATIAGYKAALIAADVLPACCRCS